MNSDNLSHFKPWLLTGNLKAEPNFTPLTLRGLAHAKGNSTVKQTISIHIVSKGVSNAQRSLRRTVLQQWDHEFRSQSAHGLG
jgi:hypothetical protein